MSKSYFSHPASVLKTHDTFHGVKHSYKKILKKVKKSPPLPTKTTKTKNKPEDTTNLSERVQLGVGGRSTSLS